MTPAPSYGGCGALPHRRGGDRLHRAGPGQGQDAQRGELSEQGNTWEGNQIISWENYNFVFGRNKILSCLGEKYNCVLEN